MVKAAAASRKIWRQICRQIFRENSTLTLPVPAQPRGQLSGAVPEAFTPPPDFPQPSPIRAWRRCRNWILRSRT